MNDDQVLAAAEASLREQRKAQGIPEPGRREDRPKEKAVRMYRPRLEFTPEQLERQRRAAEREREEGERRITADTRSEAAIDRALAAAGVLPRHRAILWDEDLVPVEVRTWAATLPAIRGNLVLCGSPGSGKTSAAVWLMRRAWLAGHLARLEDGRTRWEWPLARFAGASELFTRVFRRESLEVFEGCSMLVIDDWGMQYETDWPLAVLDHLIDQRWGNQRTTILTTNLRARPNPDPAKRAAEPPSFEDRYPRIASRLFDSEGPGPVMLVRADLRRAPR